MRARSVEQLPVGGLNLPLKTREQLLQERNPAEIQIGFLEVLFDEGQQTYMVLCEIVESGLLQDVWLSVYPRKRGQHDDPHESDSPIDRNTSVYLKDESIEWVFRPAQGSGMVPTLGVQVAIDKLATTCGWQGIGS